jgi:hypothetical protein
MALSDLSSDAENEDHKPSHGSSKVEIDSDEDEKAFDTAAMAKRAVLDSSDNDDADLDADVDLVTIL